MRIPPSLVRYADRQASQDEKPDHDSRGCEESPTSIIAEAPPAACYGTSYSFHAAILLHKAGRPGHLDNASVLPAWGHVPISSIKC